jgi:hypothetical protein
MSGSYCMPSSLFFLLLQHVVCVWKRGSDPKARRKCQTPPAVTSHPEKSVRLTATPSRQARITSILVCVAMHWQVLVIMLQYGHKYSFSSSSPINCTSYCLLPGPHNFHFSSSLRAPLLLRQSRFAAGRNPLHHASCFASMKQIQLQGLPLPTTASFCEAFDCLGVPVFVGFSAFFSLFLSFSISRSPSLPLVPTRVLHLTTLSCGKPRLQHRNSHPHKPRDGESLSNMLTAQGCFPTPPSSPSIHTLVQGSTSHGTHTLQDDVEFWGLWVCWSRCA